ncbi:MAG: hypothetical protein K2N16_07395 [Muribaculaceae bacterium]|nr:hypothetical protein [Muribaculaceae bacterium]
MSKEKLCLTAVTIGMLLIGAAILIPIITFYLEHHQPTSALFKYLFAAGAVLVLAGRVLNQYKGKNMRLKRLVRIEAWSAVFFCAAAVFMFYPPSPYMLGNMRSVLAFTLAGAIIQIYTSIMIPYVSKKSEQKKDK